MCGRNVGATGFEPATSRSQSGRSTKLSYAPGGFSRAVRQTAHRSLADARAGVAGADDLADGGTLRAVGRLPRHPSYRGDFSYLREAPIGTGCEDVSRCPIDCRMLRLRSLRGRSSMVESQSSKLVVRVRFPSPPPSLSRAAAGRAGERSCVLREANPQGGPTPPEAPRGAPTPLPDWPHGAMRCARGRRRRCAGCRASRPR